MSIICFHNPNEENGYLSNWYLRRFSCDRHIFSSTEQFMMYEKAKLFRDNEIRDKILHEDDPAKIKALGRKIKNYNEDVWSKKRYSIVYYGNLEKFSQNNDLKDKLIQTGDSIIVECAVYDKIWGIGLSLRDPNRFKPEKWKGKNLLGKVLMEVREHLKTDL